MRCPKCGFVSFDHLSTCKRCGTLLAASEAPPAPPPHPAPALERGTSPQVSDAPPDFPPEDSVAALEPAPAPAEPTSPAEEPEVPEVSAIRPASLWRRSAAAQIDGGVILALTFVGVIAVVLTVRAGAEIGRVPERAVLSIAIVASLIAWVVLSGAYHIAFVGSRGQTVGHRAMGIRVVQVAGGDMGYGRAAVRWAGIVVANLTFGLGYLPILLTPTRRGLHDFLAGSIVAEA